MPRLRLFSSSAAATLALAFALAVLRLSGAIAAPVWASNARPAGLKGALNRAVAPRFNPFQTPTHVDVRAQTSSPSPVPAPGATAPEPNACATDEECPDGTICTDGRCQTLERPVRALLFRKEGPRTAFWPLYFARSGIPGYRVVAPFYWHFFSRSEKTRILAPFYWRFENYEARRVSTALWVGPLITWSRQPDASSWGVWPVAYGSTKFGWAAPLLGSFTIKNPETGKSLGLFAFLYYWRRDLYQQEASDVFFPLVWSFRSKARATTVGFPLLWAWRRGESSNVLLLPLGFQHAEGRRKLTLGPLGYSSWAGPNQRGSLLWVYWFGRNQSKNEYDVLFPLLWSFRSETKSGTVFFPLAWHFSGPDRHSTVVGPFLDFKRPKSRFTTVLPLYYTAYDAEDKARWSLLFPFAFWRSRDGGARAFALTPLGGYARDRAKGTSGFTLLVPPIVSRRSPERDLDLVFPFYYRRVDRVTGSRALWTLLFYRSQDETGSTSTLFPLIWHFRDRVHDATATAVLPFFFRRKSPTESLTAVGAGVLAYYGDKGTRGGSGGLFPLAFFGREDDRRHAIVFPLLWHFNSPRRNFTLALPLFGHFRNGEAKTTVIFPLLYAQGETARSSYAVALPFFWHLHDVKTQRKTTVLGPAFYSRRPQAWSAGLFPLLFAGRSPKGAHTVVAPLFWHFRDHEAKSSHTLVGPYYHARVGEERTDALFPLLYFRRGAQPGKANETSFTLFPLVHYKRTPFARTFITPVAMGKATPERKAGFVGPYFWYESRTVAASGAFPLWFDFTNKQLQQRTRVVGPWVAIDDASTHARFIFPFFGRYATLKTEASGPVQETGTYVFPTYFRQRDSDGYALDTLFPLFWRSAGPKGGTIQLGPWFASRGQSTYAQGLVPLYFYGRNAKRSLLVTPVGYRWRNFEKQTSTTWMGLLFYRNTWAQGHTTVGFPLWWSGRSDARAHQVLFPLFWRFDDSQQRRTTTVLGPFFSRRTGSTNTRGVVPLAWYSRNPDTQWFSAALLPLFYVRTQPTNAAIVTPVFGRGRSATSTWWYVPPFFRRQTPTSSFAILAPLWFSHTNKVTETNTRFFLPLLHYQRSRPERSLSGWLGLFWRHRGIASATSVLFPLFFDHHAYHQSRTTGLLPLFLRHHREDTRTTYTLGPLFYRRSTPEQATTVLFPLYWDYKSEGRRSQMLFPLFARFERAGWKGTYVFPNIWYRTGKGPNEGTSRLIVFPFWESEVKRPGDTMWEVLLGLAGYERSGRNRFVKVLFIPFEISPVPRTQTAAWYGRAPRKARLEPARGFGGHIW